MPFVKGDPNINRNGRPKLSKINELCKALEAEGAKLGKDFWQEVAKKAFTNDKIMLAVMKKFIPDLHHTEMDGEIAYTMMKAIVIEHKTMELNFGNNRTSENSRNAFKADTPNNED